MSAPFKSSTVPRRRCGTFADMRAIGWQTAIVPVMQVKGKVERKLRHAGGIRKFRAELRQSKER